MGVVSEQQVLFETEEVRSLLDQLLADSRLYTRSVEYKGLLDFVVRLRNFAPFNAIRGSADYQELADHRLRGREDLG